MTAILYHGGCVDGFTAAWLVNRVVDPSARMIPCTHPQSIVPDTHDEHVYIVDFSFPPQIVVAMLEQNRSVHLWDHHKTAVDQWAGISTGPDSGLNQNLDLVLDMDRSGAGIAYAQLAHRLEGWRTQPGIRDIVTHVEDRDLWKFRFERSKDIFAAMTARPWTLEAWDEMMLMSVTDLAAQGAAVEMYRHRRIEDAVARAHWISVDGYRVPIANCDYAYGSDVAAALLERHPDAPFAMYYLCHPDKTQYGLRSTDERVDVEAIAKLNGGGGHRNASGFVLPLVPPHDPA